MRRATAAYIIADRTATISIHALHEESDPSCIRPSTNTKHISIHALHEESDLKGRKASITDGFQSTLSMRRATFLFGAGGERVAISIHALHEESDSRLKGDGDELKAFQSTLSMRRATFFMVNPSLGCQFQSTLSMRRATVQLDIFVRFLRRKPAA